jgi:hypothetical protein
MKKRTLAISAGRTIDFESSAEADRPPLHCVVLWAREESIQ